MYAPRTKETAIDLASSGDHFVTRRVPKLRGPLRSHTAVQPPMRRKFFAQSALFLVCPEEETAKGEHSTYRAQPQL